VGLAFWRACRLRRWSNGADGFRPRVEGIRQKREARQGLALARE
jgi:hypothetical protein